MMVMVSPFISPDEKQVMQMLLKEQHPFVLLTGNGFRDLVLNGMAEEICNGLNGNGKGVL